MKWQDDKTRMLDYRKLGVNVCRSTNSSLTAFLMDLTKTKCCKEAKNPILIKNSSSSSDKTI